MGGQITYTRHKCFYCDRVISSNGLAKISHYRSHVRKNECIEIHHRNTEQGFHYQYIKSFNGLNPAFETISQWQKKNPNELVLEKYPHLKEIKK